MKNLILTMDNFRKALKEMNAVVFGAGEYCLRFLNRLEIEELERIGFIVDNDPDKQGKTIFNIPVKEPKAISDLSVSDTIVIIAVGNSIAEIYKQIKDIGDYTIVSSRILMTETLSLAAKELYLSQTEIKLVSDLLCDEKSRYIYNEAIRRRMLYGECDFSDLIIRGDAEYRPPFFHSKTPAKDEIIIDCGAYNGDTLKKFADTYEDKLKKIYCFDCVEENIEDLAVSIEHIKNKKYFPDMIIMPYALSDQTGKMKLAKYKKRTGSFLLSNRGFAQSTLYESDYVDVDVTTLDKVIPQDEKITLIKMDIEGSEWAALHGAETLIRRCKPRLAISIYHCGEDYTRIPLYLKRIVPEYKLAVRHHNKNHCDTDLYCWIEE